jgi:hypothetical protein
MMRLDLNHPSDSAAAYSQNLAELGEMVNDLHAEVVLMTKGAESQASGERKLYRRGFVRAVTALAEGSCYALKQVIATAPLDPPLDAVELLMLNEKQVKLGSKGEVDTAKAKLNSVDNIRFALSIACEACEIPPVDFGNHGWEMVGKAFRIRDRLTHPKSSAELIVSDDEMNIVTAADEWLGETFSRILKDLVKVMEHSLAAKRDRSTVRR